MIMTFQPYLPDVLACKWVIRYIIHVQGLSTRKDEAFSFLWIPNIVGLRGWFALQSKQIYGMRFITFLDYGACNKLRVFVNFSSVFYKEIFSIAVLDINVDENYDIQKVSKFLFSPRAWP